MEQISPSPHVGSELLLHLTLMHFSVYEFISGAGSKKELRSLSRFEFELLRAKLSANFERALQIIILERVGMNSAASVSKYRVLICISIRQKD